MNTRSAIVAIWISVCPLAASSVGAEAGLKLFKKHCAPCHGQDGRARTRVARVLGVKDLTKSKIGESEIKSQILRGKKGNDGKQKMPSFEDALSEQEIEKLIEIVKKFRKSR